MPTHLLHVVWFVGQRCASVCDHSVCPHCAVIRGTHSWHVWVWCAMYVSAANTHTGCACASSLILQLAMPRIPSHTVFREQAVTYRGCLGQTQGVHATTHQQSHAVGWPSRAPLHQFGLVMSASYRQTRFACLGRVFDIGVLCRQVRDARSRFSLSLSLFGCVCVCCWVS